MVSHFTPKFCEVNSSTLKCRRVHCVKNDVRQIMKKTAKNEIEKRKKNESANSVDPNEMAHMSHLICIKTVLPNFFSGL